jgi:ABC-type phosphate transport system substrate-binding protein
MHPVRVLRGAAIATTSLALIVASALPAPSDPPFLPDNDDIVLVGADTAQHLMNDLAQIYNSNPYWTPARRLTSFDATGYYTEIVIRQSEPTISRPSGSNAGIWVLNTIPKIDAANSSRGPRPGDPADFKFLKLAQDELRWAANDNAGVSSLTDAQLTARRIRCRRQRRGSAPAAPSR